MAYTLQNLIYEKLRNCSRIKETKEKGQLNAMCDPQLDSEPETKSYNGYYGNKE